MNMQTVDDPRYVFVCGLGRSGTSVLARNIARLENCSGFKNTGVLEDEGQFLQDVYPSDNVYGGAAAFGFDPRAHLTENSPLFTPENALKLRQNWERYWDQARSIRVEKTPGHLLKTRFLQAVFPNSYFIVVRRHPISVSLANNQRWKVTFAPLQKLFDHWLYCYGLFEEDKRYLKHVYELTYEEYIEDPNKCYQRIAEFVGTRVPQAPREDSFYYVTQWRNPIGLRVPETAMEDVSGAHNEKYFNRWSHLLDKSPYKRYYRYLAAKYEPKFAKYGYSLIKGFVADENRIREAEHISAITAAFYSRAAEVCAMSVRTPLQAKGYIKKQLRAHLPQSVKLRMKHLFGKMAFKKQPKAVSS